MGHAVPRYNVQLYSNQVVCPTHVRRHVERFELCVVEYKVLRAIANLLAHRQLRALILEPFLSGVYARLPSCVHLSCDPIDKMPRRHGEVEDPIYLMLAVVWPAIEGALELSI